MNSVNQPLPDGSTEDAIAKRRKAAQERRRKQIRRERIIIGCLAAVIIIAAGIISFLIFRQKQILSQPAVQNEQTQTAADVNTGTADADIADAKQAAADTDPLPDAADAGASTVEVSPEGIESAEGTLADHTPEDGTSDAVTVTAADNSVSEAIASADRMAAGYDYDGAIAHLSGLEGADSNEAIQTAISSYQEAKDSCVAVDVSTVPHIFYHSLVNEPDIAFSASLQGQFAADGMNAWMTTVDEFDKITQQLYDNGYVYVRLRDLVNETVDENGEVHYSPRTDLMLPEGKKAIVLSIDDLSYYHSYESCSFPDKLVLDENGQVKCHYVKPDGTESIGDYDVVPRLNSFLEEHPDGAYQGARGLIALTGYNGVFGYRTDIDYEAQEHLMADQSAWLAAHPDFNRQDEIEQATVIANALKEEGWEFASHTWGHLSVTSKSADELAADNQKWVNNVQNIVGPTDTIIFAHGNDIGDWMPYSSDNEKYTMYRNAGYHYFCNVDGSVPYWVQINDDCVRQGRINLDGYMLYQSSIGATTSIDALVTASQVFDSRRPTPVVANGEG